MTPDECYKKDYWSNYLPLVSIHLINHSFLSQQIGVENSCKLGYLFILQCFIYLLKELSYYYLLFIKPIFLAFIPYFIKLQWRSKVKSCPHILNFRSRWLFNLIMGTIQLLVCLPLSFIIEDFLKLSNNVLIFFNRSIQKLNWRLKLILARWIRRWLGCT
jgi:hypothetical protein